MSTDWHLRVRDSLGNELIPSTPLLTMMIDRQQRSNTFTASMILDYESLHHLNLQNTTFYCLNYYCRSYPDNSFILKDAILTSVNVSWESDSNNMHVQASWQYYDEEGGIEYRNEFDFIDRIERNSDTPYNAFYALYLDENLDYTPHWQGVVIKQDNLNWKSFGF